jgi:hypothetical protein
MQQLLKSLSQSPKPNKMLPSTMHNQAKIRIKMMGILYRQVLTLL